MAHGGHGHHDDIRGTKPCIGVILDGGRIISPSAGTFTAVQPHLYGNSGISFDDGASGQRVFGSVFYQTDGIGAVKYHGSQFNEFINTNAPNRQPTPMITSRALMTWLAIAMLTGGLGRAVAATGHELTLWYDRPASQWAEALLVGNGRLGGMVHGGVEKETIDLNEDTVWSGSPHDYTNPGSHQYLEELRALIRAEKYDEAARFGAEHMRGGPRTQKIYQKLGELLLAFPGHAAPQDYRRQLNLAEGVVRVQYRIDDATFTREILASHPDQVIAIRLSCDQPGRISFIAELATSHRKSSHETPGVNSVALLGKSDAIRFQSQIQAKCQGGSMSTEAGKLTVTSADSAVLLLAAATSFVNYHDISADPAKKCRDYLAQAEFRTFEEIRSRHVADHGAPFNRVSIDLGGKEADTKIPTHPLLKEIIGGRPSELLDEQLFQFGRYLTITGARPGTQPLNLVGIWAEGLNAPWGGKWTLNINAELNTWPVENCNLAECHEPLLEDLRVTGAEVAREHYQCRGFVAHHNTDLWRGAAPVDTSIHGLWPMGSAWLCRHIWEHSDFSRDLDYLRRSYPTMKESAQFYLDYLTVDGDGFLATCPPISFEQDLQKPDGTQGRLCSGPMMDNQILHDLFSNCIAASEKIGDDPAFRQQLIRRLRC